MVRLPADLADMVAWLGRVQKRTSAQIIDPIVRPEIEAMYTKFHREISAIKKAEDAAAVASGLPTGPPLPPPLKHDKG